MREGDLESKCVAGGGSLLPGQEGVCITEGCSLHNPHNPNKVRRGRAAAGRVVFHVRFDSVSCALCWVPSVSCVRFDSAQQT